MLKLRSRHKILWGIFLLILGSTLAIVNVAHLGFLGGTLQHLTSVDVEMGNEDLLKKTVYALLALGGLMMLSGSLFLMVGISKYIKHRTPRHR